MNELSITFLSRSLQSLLTIIAWECFRALIGSELVVYAILLVAVAALLLTLLWEVAARLSNTDPTISVFNIEPVESDLYKDHCFEGNKIPDN